jgi:hypothetical protein
MGTGGDGKRKRTTNLALIVAGSLLVGLVVIGMIAGATQDAEFGQSSSASELTGGRIVALVVGVLLVLVGVILHAADRAGGSRNGDAPDRGDPGRRR